jgi:membrane protease subunit HflC
VAAGAARDEESAVTPLRRTLLVAVVVVAGLAAWSSLVVIDATEFGVFTRFGRVVRIAAAPGLRLKWPAPVERVARVDRRLLTFMPAPAEYLSEDRKNLVVHGLVTWRIADPVRYLATAGSRPLAQERLADVVLAAVGNVIGSHASSAVISVDGRGSRFAEVMRGILDEARPRILADYGIDLVDVRLRQLTLPEQNRANVFARMQAERGKIAMKYRSEGEREFRKLVAVAEREKTRILAEAYREAERLKAEGDAHAMQIYADAFGRGPQFYKFTRTLTAYEKMLDGNTTIFLPADAEIFRILDGRPAGAGP